MKIKHSQYLTDEGKINPKLLVFGGGKKQDASKKIVATLNGMSFKVETNIFKRVVIGCYLVLRALLIELTKGEKNEI